ncbi:LysM peptidoglycan-binding domain-containing protein, partial [Enterococcus faecium]|nr:LysM peptidoglycan-binding domain-containing protein [Enterococcus faecium]
TSEASSEVTSESSSVEQSDATSSSSTDGNASYATVQSGQGMYRVAVNNGISVQKLMELNGLTRVQILNQDNNLE